MNQRILVLSPGKEALLHFSWLSTGKAVMWKQDEILADMTMHRVHRCI